MNFIIQHHTVRCFDFFDFIFAEIEFTALGKSVLARSNGIHNLALCEAHCSVRSDNILGCTDFINCARKSGDFINRLINNLGFLRAAYAYSVEHFAGFLYGDCAFLCHIRLIHFYHCNPAFFGSVILRYIEVHRSAVENISVGSLNLNKRISLAVFQLLRCHKTAVCVGVKGVDCCRSRVGKGHCNKISCRIVNLKACSGIRNGLAAFCVHLDHLDIAFKVCIVDKVTVGLSVLSNEHIKVLHHFTAFPAGSLMNGIYAVRHILCLSEAVFVADDNISLIFLRSGIASCEFEVDFKGCTAFRRFNLGFSIVGMLDDGDIALDNLLVYIVCSLIVFHRIKLRFSTDLVDCGVKQITLGRSDFTDCPVIVADIFLRGELPVFVRNIFVHKGFALINAVNCSGKRSITLGGTFFTVALCHGHGKLFENVCEIAGSNLFPLNRCSLISRDYITDSRIHFLNVVGRFA